MIVSHFLVPRVLFEQANALSLSATVVYLRLCALVEPGETRMALSTADLAARCGFTQRTIFAAIAQLEQIGLVERERNRSTCVNEYHLIVPSHDCEEIGPPHIGDATLTSPVCVGMTNGAIAAPAKPVRHECEVVHNEQEAPTVSQLKPLDDLIAAAYSDRYRPADVRAHVALTDMELRACLERLMAQGGVSPEMPVGFFAAIIRKVHHEIYG